ncbi:DUF2637 domain-containing protein [Thermomonospora cellulosilytica]|uniref:DUF2637 domain-containing protein n=1 Tax=Thermomonospora cellulosilytica TaxID=1411118 RepID=A0A7W3MWM4_9ACTN|nr:DUF2637 domain-containing protein [Thermomonospora cellulosilytica]MBA9003267.1 hypothetical protein [Thermomonospora cellulosilytica]
MNVVSPLTAPEMRAMASEDSSAAPTADGAGSGSGSVPPPAAGRTQHRLMTVAAGLGVVVLAGATFVLTYDDLRALALAGGAARRWAPAYPVMVDVLLTVIVVALAAARNARWWSRWPRWALLFLVLGGTAAASVQRAVRGYEPLPDETLRAGVAVAPYVMLVIVVWLWLAMFRQLHRSPSRAAAAPVAPDVPAAESAETAEAPPAPQDGPPPELPATRPDSAWLFDDEDDHDEPEVPRQAAVPPLEDADPAVPPLDLPERYDGLPGDTGPAFESPEPLHEPDSAFDQPGDDDAEPVFAADVDDDPTPPAGYPSLLPTDVELVRGGARPEVKPAATTRPDIVMPDPEELAQAAHAAQAAQDDDGEPGEDRAEDPDGGDRVPFHDELIDEDRELPPPSGSLRSSPTPPRD